MSRQNIADKMKAAREAAGLTQKKLAKRLLVSQAQVAKWESGSDSIKVETLERIAAALKIGITELLV